ncbi:MAG TPA: hypothetical protein PKI03_28135 [Pseudomonadota bacterium]|nr:hypothetical protein [Pseudomonadota bacterium]
MLRFVLMLRDYLLVVLTLIANGLLRPPGRRGSAPTTATPRD